MSTRTGASTQPSASARATPGRRVIRHAGAKRSIQIDRNAALRMSPLELRDAIALERAHATALDYEDEADLTGLEADEVEFDDMDGDEIASEGVDEANTSPEPMSYVLQPDSLAEREQASPFVDPSSVYPITVIPGEGGRPARAYFDPPAWFGRVRGSSGRAAVRRIERVVRAIVDVLSDDFDAFLKEPSASSFGECEWRYFAKGHAPLRETALIRKGLVDRLNTRLGRISRVDEPSLGGLLPHLWVLWPPSADGLVGTVVMPVAAIYAREFQLAAAAILCAGGLARWTLTDPARPSTWDRSQQASRPFRQLDQRQRLHLMADFLRVSPKELLASVRRLFDEQGNPRLPSERTP